MLEQWLGALFCIAMMLIPFGIIWFIFTKIIKISHGKKIYRVIGLYKIMTIISILSFVVFVGIIVFMKIANVPYLVFNFFTLLMQCAVPLIFMISIRRILNSCKCCGHINTFKLLSYESHSLGIAPKFHTEGGYYKNVTTTGTIDRPWYEGGSMNVDVTTQQYIPETTVYDGMYETKSYYSTYKCTVCGNIVTESGSSEYKI